MAYPGSYSVPRRREDSRSAPNADARRLWGGKMEFGALRGAEWGMFLKVSRWVCYLSLLFILEIKPVIDLIRHIIIKSKT